MKKILIYLVSFVLICFIVPSLLTKRTKTAANQDVNAKNIEQSEYNKQEVKNQESSQQEKSQEYQYKKYGTINLLHKCTGQVEQVNLDDYLCNVVSAEMPATYETEALKAQAIVARTYTVYKILNKKHDNADICDDSKCCQAWISKEDRLNRWEESQRNSNWDKICKSVNDTKGQIITYNNQPIDAFFHSNSGGVTEVPVNVWGGTGYPYLQSVQTSGEEAYTQYASEVVFTQEELLNKLKEKYNDISIDFANDDDIKILEFTESTRVKTIKFGNHNLSGVEARTLLGLKSTNFEISKENNNIKFSVKGYGHGVGMSQTGADSMAKQGNNAENIIKHFYTGVEVKDLNNV